MEGEDSAEKRGLTRRILELLFEKIKEIEKDEQNKAWLALSVTQIYNEEVYDLLSETAKNVKIRLSKNGFPYVED